MKPDERLETILLHYCLSIPELTRRLNFDRPQKLYDIQKGKTKSISVEMANAFSSAFPEISQKWLRTGKGEMFGDSTTINNNNSPGAINGGTAAFNRAKVHVNNNFTHDPRLDSLAQSVERLTLSLSDCLKQQDKLINIIAQYSASAAAAATTTPDA